MSGLPRRVARALYYRVRPRVAAVTRWLWLPNFALQPRVTCTDCFVTCTGKTDGPLAQIQAVISTILFARAAGIAYVHTPLRVVEHAEGQDDWARRWEEFFSFGNGEMSLADLSPGLRQVRVEYPQRILKRRKTLYVIPHSHDFADRYPQLYEGLLPELRQRYFVAAKDVPLHRQPGLLNIAVHLRRGDVSPDVPHFAPRFTSNRKVAHTVRSVSDLLDRLGVDYRVRIYSQGQPENFGELTALGELHLDECPFATFHNLVMSDVLVMAKSSFSHVAALLSPRGLRLYEPFWHRPQRDWVVLDESGGFPQQRLERALQDLCGDLSR
jgi:hypothetical protein